MAAGAALLSNSELSAYEIAEKSMIIASNMCIYTNNNFKFEQLN